MVKVKAAEFVVFLASQARPTVKLTGAVIDLTSAQLDYLGDGGSHKSDMVPPDKTYIVLMSFIYLTKWW